MIWLLPGIGGMRLDRLSAEPGVAGDVDAIGSVVVKYETRLELAEGGERAWKGPISVESGGGGGLDGSDAPICPSSASEPSKE